MRIQRHACRHWSWLRLLREQDVATGFSELKPRAQVWTPELTSQVVERWLVLPQPEQNLQVILRDPEPFHSKRLVKVRGSRERAADRDGERVQPLHPLLVGAEAREGRPPVPPHQLVSFLERRAAESVLQQGDGDDFRIGEAGPAVRRTPPARPRGVGLEVVINEAVDFGHLMLYAAHWSFSSVGGR